MGKWIAIGLAGSVVAVIVGMQLFMFDRSQGTPAGGSASKVSQDSLKKQIKDAIKEPVKDAANQLKDAAKRGADAAVGNAPAPSAQSTANPNLVGPESLPNGFILVVTDKSRKASQSSPIFMPSSHNGWNPGDEKMKLIPGSDMKWRIEWNKPTLDSRIAFKFTRGSWESVETTAEFKQIENRLLPLVDISKVKPGEKPLIELEIVQWDDNKPEDASVTFANRYRPISVAAGSVKRVQVVGGADRSLQRELIVWLPPGYDAPENQTKTYPVLYMNDGQNVFEKVPGLAAEWGADETATALIAKGTVEPLIIVAIPNAGALRNAEYLPIPVLANTPALGANYVEFLVHEVMPKIERGFRVKTGPEFTGIGGASLGGLIAIEAGTRYPDKFGIVLAESTPLSQRTESGVDRVGFNHFAKAARFPAKLYFAMGGKELGDKADAGRNQDFVDSVQAFAELARGKGVTANHLKTVIDPDASHNEAAWAKRFGPALEFLYPKK